VILAPPAPNGSVRLSGLWSTSRPLGPLLKLRNAGNGNCRSFHPSFRNAFSPLGRVGEYHSTADRGGLTYNFGFVSIFDSLRSSRWAARPMSKTWQRNGCAAGRVPLFALPTGCRSVVRLSYPISYSRVTFFLFPGRSDRPDRRASTGLILHWFLTENNVFTILPPTPRIFKSFPTRLTPTRL